MYKIIGDSLRKDPGLLVSDYYKPMELVTHDIAVFFCVNYLTVIHHVNDLFIRYRLNYVVKTSRLLHDGI